MPLKNTVKIAKQFLTHKILHIDDTPQRLALGVAIGFFCAWTPMIGFQSAMVVAFAIALGANKVVGLPFVWISNPLTLVPIYWSNYLFGNAVMAIFVERPRFSFKDFENAIREFVKGFEGVFNFQTWHNLYNLLVKFLDLTVDLWIGSILVGLILAIISYFASYRLIVWYRTNTPHGRAFMKKLLRKKTREKSTFIGQQKDLQ